MHTSNTDHDETLKEQILEIISDIHNHTLSIGIYTPGDKRVAEMYRESEEAIMQLTTQARIDELEQLWNSTQPDIVPDGIPANDMSEALHKRIEKLRSES